MTAADAAIAAKPHRLTEARAVVTACAVLSLVLAAPIMAMSVPWFCDLYFHMARMAILENPHAAHISDWYRSDWRLLPNLAMDLVVPTLGTAIGTAAATRVFVALTFVLTFTGTVALHHAIHRKVTWFPLVARLRQTRPGPHEIGRSLAITAVPFLVPLVLLLTSRTVEASAPGLDYVLAAKLFALLTPFITVNIPVDLAIAAGTVALLYLLARERALVVAPELRFALVALPMLVLAIPTSFFGTDLADFRLPALGIFIAIAACRFGEQSSHRLRRGVLAGAAALFAIRMTAIAIDFATAEPEVKAITQQFRAMKPGAVLFTGTFEHRSFLVDLFAKPENWLAPWQRRNVVPFRHIGTMAVLYQPVLVPETTMIDGQQPVAMLPPFRALKALQSQDHVARALTGPDDLKRWLREIRAIVARPPYRFTAVYVALSDPLGLAEPPPGIVERFSQYNYRIWDASEWMAR